jgi:aspartyl-tRNA(Asn)/glutamyl-tRNA(Gln) amidotransferase subunit A
MPRSARVDQVGADSWNAFVTRVEPGEPRPGPLSGRTLGVKDLFDTAGVRTTYGSRIYADHVPGRNAVAVQRLLDAGAVMVGKTHLPEFAWCVIGVNPWLGTCRNPAHPGKTTGGSSSGSAAALAAGLCDLALGSDTGGSIRIPSACCDTVGLKPQWGRIPLDGIFPLCPSLDTAGPMARSVADVALMWSVLAGAEVPDPLLAGRMVGLLRRAPAVGGSYVPVASDIGERWVADLERLGASVVEAEIPEPIANTWPLFEHEAAIVHRETFPSRADDYGPTIRPKLERAQHVEPDEVEAAYSALRNWRAYQPPVDLYVSPCLTGELPVEDVDEREVRFELSGFARWVNLTGWASLTIGNMQLIAPRDETVLAAGLAWERG